VLTLALDTSTRLGGIAVSRDGRLVAETSLSVRATRSETVLPEVERLLERAGEGPGGLGRVVVGAGPGSFTGIRIAAALAKGLCAAREADLYAYSSLAAVAAEADAAVPVCVLFDARRDEVYAAAWEAPPPAPHLLPPTAAALDEVLEALGPLEGWSFAGEGARRYRDRIEEAGGRVLPPTHDYPRASGLLELLRRSPGAGRVAQRRDWEPTYVRASGAERGV